MSLVTFFVPGKPHAWQRARHNGGQMFTDARTRAYKHAVGTLAKAALAGAVLVGPVEMRVAAIYAVPPSWTKKRREAALNEAVRPVSRPDIDNIAKGVMDALNGIAYDDDAQVVQLTVSKRYGEHEGVLVQISTISADHRNAA